MARLISRLPEDLEMNILLRLPAKSIMRFRCVSNTWNSLFTSSNFITAYLRQNHNNRDHGFLFLNSQTKDLTNCFRLLSHDSFNVFFNHTIPFRSGWSVVGCCNGLICLYDDSGNQGILVYNPSIRKQRFISCELDLRNHERPRRCSIAFGFGCDSLTKDYKVVMLFSPYKFTDEVAEVYKLQGVDLWRKIETPIPENITFPDYYGNYNVLYLNGAAHWLGQRQTSSKSYVVVSFDFTREVFQWFPVPNKVTDGADWNRLNHLNIYLNRGLLCVGKYVLNGNDVCFDIWAMSEYGVEDSWNFLHRFKILGKWFYNSVLGFGMKGELFVNYKDQLTVHYPDDDKNVKTVLEIEDDDERFLGVVTCTESLVSP